MTENLLIYTSLKTKYPSEFAAQQNLHDKVIDIRGCSKRYQFKRSEITQCGLLQTPSKSRAKRLPNCGIRISSQSQKEAEKEEYYPGPSTARGVSWGCSVLFTKKYMRSAIQRAHKTTRK
jgi:hypothetical protein